MGHRIINRYDHNQIIREFADITNQYFIHNQHKASNKNSFKKIAISLFIVALLAFAFFNKPKIVQNKSLRVLFLILLIVAVILFKRIDVSTGMVIGQYSFKNQHIIYQISYIPLTNRCILKEKKSTGIRQRQFVYNDFVDQSGNIIQKSYLDLLQSFLNLQTQVLMEQY